MGGGDDSGYWTLSAGSDEEETPQRSEESEQKETSVEEKESPQETKEETLVTDQYVIKSRERFEQPILLLRDGEEEQIRLEPFSEYGPVSEVELTPQIRALEQNGRIELKSVTA